MFHGVLVYFSIVMERYHDDGNYKRKYLIGGFLIVSSWVITIMVGSTLAGRHVSRKRVESLHLMSELEAEKGGRKSEGDIEAGREEEEGREKKGGRKGLIESGMDF